MSGQSVIRPSKTRWTSTTAELPRSPRRSCARTDRGGRTAAASVWGTDTITASAGDGTAVGTTSKPASVSSARTVLTLVEMYRVAPAPEPTSAALTVQGPEGTRLQPMSAAEASRSRPVWNTFAAMASDASAAGRLTVGTVIRSQRPSMAAGDCPWGASQAPKVSGRPAADHQVHAAQGEHGPPEPAGPRQMREAERGNRARCSGAGSEPRRSRPTRGRPPGRADGAQHRNVEPVRHSTSAGRPDAVEEREVLLAAAKEHVLAVVDPRSAVRERPRHTAQRLRRSSRVARAPASAQSRAARHAGQAAPDDHDVAAVQRCRPLIHAAPRVSARAATASFCSGRSDTRRCSTDAGVSLNLGEQPPVDAGHRGRACPRPPVEEGQERQAPVVPLLGTRRSRTR